MRRAERGRTFNAVDVVGHYLKASGSGLGLGSEAPCAFSGCSGVRPYMSSRGVCDDRADAVQASDFFLARAPSPSPKLIARFELRPRSPARLPARAGTRPSRRLAGKKVSRASSASVMSTGVPNTVVVLMKFRTPAGPASCRGTMTPTVTAIGLRRAGRRRIVCQFFEQCRQRLVRRNVDLPTQPCEEVFAPLREIDNARREPFGMQAQTQHVDRRCEEMRRDVLKYGRDCGIGHQQVPMTIDCEGRKRLMPLEHEGHGFARGLESWIRQWVLGKHGRETCGEQQRVAASQGDLQQLGKTQHHVATWLRAAGFEKTQVACRDLGLGRHAKLTEAPALPPFTEQLADGYVGIHAVRTIAHLCRALHYQAGNRLRACEPGSFLTAPLVVAGVPRSRS